jgi:hypothetical protein
MKRRTLLAGLAGIFASGIAPGVASSGVFMPVRKIIVPDQFGTRGWCLMPGYERYDGRVQFSQASDPKVWGDGLMGSPEYRAAQRAMNIQMRRLMGNAPVRQLKPGWQSNGDYLAFIHSGWMK